MAVVKIHSVNFGPISDWALWTRETQHIQVDRLLVLQTFAATVMNKLCPYVLLVELLGPGNPVDDRLCSGLSWTLLTAAFLRDADTIKVVLDRSCGTDLSEGLLNTALEVAVLQGDFEAVGMLLPRNTGPTRRVLAKAIKVPMVARYDKLVLRAAHRYAYSGCGSTAYCYLPN